MCRYLFGYDIYTAPVVVDGVADKTTLFTPYTKHFTPKSYPMSVSLGPNLKGLAPLIPADNQQNVGPSLAKRVGREFAPRDHALVREFKEFSRRFIRKKFQRKITADEPFDFEEWLAHTHYNEGRKKQLRDHRTANHDISEEIITRLDKECDTFTKFEFYFDKWACARGINARKDRAKMKMGPVTKKIEEIVYADYYAFIKHVPVKDRPKYMSKVLGTQGPYYVSDYTAFESLFYRDLFESCEFELYSHLLSEHPRHDYFMKLFRTVMTGKNIMNGKHGRSVVYDRRMSGEMNTSLGNGITNLLIQKFVAYKSGAHIKLFIEGDDAIISSSANLDVSIYSRLGVRAKVEKHDTIGTTSFCGILYDPECFQQIVDPRKSLIGFGWSKRDNIFSRSSTKRALLRTKALSFLYQTPACPCISSFCRMILRNTRNINVSRIIKNETNWWEKQWHSEIRSNCPQYFNPGYVGQVEEIMRGTRDLVEKLFKIPIEEQLRFEQYMDTITTLEEVDVSAFPSFDMSKETLMYCRFTEMFPAKVRPKDLADALHLQPLYNLDWRMHPEPSLPEG